MFSVLPEVLSRQVLLHTIQNVVYFYKNTFEYQFEAILLLFAIASTIGSFAYIV